MPFAKNPLKRYLPGIPSQRVRRNGRRPVVTARSLTAPPRIFGPGVPVFPVSDTYADGVPEDVK